MTLKAETNASSDVLRKEIAASLRAVTKLGDMSSWSAPAPGRTTA